MYMYGFFGHVWLQLPTLHWVMQCPVPPACSSGSW